MTQAAMVGLCGKKESGKSAVAEYLMDQGFFEPRPLAGPLKLVARLIFGFSDEQLYGKDKELVDPRLGLSARHVMQQLGTEVVRGIHPLSWIFAWERSLSTVSEGASIVVDDVRFPNEVQAIKDHGGIVLKLEKLGAPALLDVHASENTDLLEADFDIAALDGDLDTLYARVMEVLEL